MEIYSETTHLFTKRCTAYLKQIIQNELGHQVNRSRFVINQVSYPIQIIVFQKNSPLAYFDPEFYRIGMNSTLIYQVKESILKDILRHELAHYICYIENPNNYFKAHGKEFKEICKRYNWREEVLRASMNIEIENKLRHGELESEKLISRVKKLLNLAQSSNEHEAQLATIKANQLLLNHQIAKLDLDQSTVYVTRLLKSKKNNAKLQSIYEILQHFMVNTVIRYGTSAVYLEVSGSKENIELAEYVCNFLDCKFEQLWKESSLKGLKAKNSFFLGIAKGYDQKCLKMKTENFDSKALIQVKQVLTKQFQMVYKRTAKIANKRDFSQDAFQAGVNKGRDLTINQAIKNKNALLRLIGN